MYFIIILVTGIRNNTKDWLIKFHFHPKLKELRKATYHHTYLHVLVNFPFPGRQIQLTKNQAGQTSLQLMTTLLNTSRWRLFVEKSATATVCVQDRTALKASWLYLFPAISVLRTFSTIWDWWFQSEHLGSADSYVSFYLTKQAKSMKKTEHFCSSKYVFNQGPENKPRKKMFWHQG